jgi:general secretion pathway protein E
VGDKEIDVRVSIIPSAYGEQVTMRLLDKNAGMVGLGDIGMSPALEKMVASLISRPQGVFLVTGPTGSGKPQLCIGTHFINTPEYLP